MNSYILPKKNIFFSYLQYKKELVDIHQKDKQFDSFLEKKPHLQEGIYHIRLYIWYTLFFMYLFTLFYTSITFPLYLDNIIQSWKIPFFPITIITLLILIISLLDNVLVCYLPPPFSIFSFCFYFPYKQTKKDNQYIRIPKIGYFRSIDDSYILNDYERLNFFTHKLYSVLLFIQIFLINNLFLNNLKIYSYLNIIYYLYITYLFLNDLCYIIFLKISLTDVWCVGFFRVVSILIIFTFYSFNIFKFILISLKIDGIFSNFSKF